MPNMLAVELAKIEQWYASVVTDVAVYRDNPPLAALAIIQRARDTREALITEAWVSHITGEHSCK